MIHTILITDTETTGLDPKTDRCIEVACVRYDVVLATVTECFSSLIFGHGNAAESINHISPVALIAARLSGHVWDRVEGMVRAAQELGPTVYMAHRAEFDRSFYAPDVAALAPWVCSKFDVAWPLSKPGASLVDVALAHGVPVHDNHRALTDCMLLAKTLQRCTELGHDVQAMLTRAMLPRTVIRAMVSYDDRQLAKDAGFSFDGTTKQWTKRVVVGEPMNVPFKVQEVG